MPTPTKNPIAFALYVNAALLLGIFLLLLSRPGSPGLTPAALGQFQPPIAGGAGVFVMPAQFHQNVWGCYLLDVDAQTLCTYEYSAGDHVLKLTSARNFRYDRLLKDFATDPPPWEVQQMVEKEKAQEQQNGLGQPAGGAAGQ
ncbi:MAG TPA: hypothetical protein VMD30_12745 [Tepidisphaeraceae bacterium]|nr:hypothetical protein [Tepidisphaeraceae bacterium]